MYIMSLQYSVGLNSTIQCLPVEVEGQVTLGTLACRHLRDRGATGLERRDAWKVRGAPRKDRGASECLRGRGSAGRARAPTQRPRGDPRVLHGESVVLHGESEELHKESEVLQVTHKYYSESQRCCRKGQALTLILKRARKSSTTSWLFPVRLDMADVTDLPPLSQLLY